MSDLVLIDGSSGEGGGQIVRSSLTLSMLTGRTVEITNIRARRKKPGLLRQHLTAVNAAREISGGGVTGDHLGSNRLIFAPGRIQCRDFKFDIGSAGSTTLVAQTLIPALMLTEEKSSIEIEGGTHNQAAPPYHFLQGVYLPILQQMGASFSPELLSWGFYPAGGGRIKIEIEPTQSLNGLELTEFDPHPEANVISVVSRLPESIGQRECELIRRRAGWKKRQCEVLLIKDSPGPGNVVMIFLKSTKITEVFTAFGKQGLPAEKVATHAWQQARDYLSAGAPVGGHLCDQLLLPLSIAATKGNPSQFITGQLSQHSETHIDLISKFLEIEIQVQPLDPRRYRIVIDPKN